MIDAPLVTAVGKARARRSLRRLTGFALEPPCHLRRENPKKSPSGRAAPAHELLVSGRARL